VACTINFISVKAAVARGYTNCGVPSCTGWQSAHDYWFGWNFTNYVFQALIRAVAAERLTFICCREARREPVSGLLLVPKGGRVLELLKAHAWRKHSCETLWPVLLWAEICPWRRTSRIISDYTRDYTASSACIRQSWFFARWHLTLKRAVVNHAPFDCNGLQIITSWWFNPFEKYSQNRNLHQVGMEIKKVYLKPPPR